MKSSEAFKMLCSTARTSILLAATFLTSSAIATAQIGETTRVSVDSAGIQANNDSIHPALSADARFVAFKSEATNLVLGDTNGAIDVFVHDRATGATLRVNVDSSGAEANGFSLNPSISADGRFVVFGSVASNLVLGDSNGTADVFVRDLATGQTTRASVDSAGNEGNDWSNTWGDTASISADGRLVAFSSFASNLVPEDTNGAVDVFVRDVVLGQTVRVSVDSKGTQGDLVSSFPAISANGRYVALQSLAGNFDAGDTNLAEDIFVHDRQTGGMAWVSVDPAGGPGNAASYGPSISADGRFVAFTSYASNLLPSDTNNAADVFVRDRVTGQLWRVSVDSTGIEGNLGSAQPAISADGRYVTFESGASNLVPGDTNGELDVFVHDLQTGETVRASTDGAGGQVNRESREPSISADGRLVGFTSDATNLVPGDTNGVADVFVHDAFDCTPSTYCTAKTTSHLCFPAIQGIGAPSLGDPSGFTISTTQLEDNKNSLTFFGTTGAAGVPFQDGFLCVQPPLYRLSIQNSGGTSICEGSISYTLADILAHSAGGPLVTAGTLVYCQTWGRDPLDSYGSSLSDALRIQVCP